MFIRTPHNSALAASAAYPQPWIVEGVKSMDLGSLDLGGGPRPHPGRPT